MEGRVFLHIIRCFTLIITIFIIANTVTLALDRHPMSSKEKANLETANLIFTIFFLIELILKMISYGMIDYYRDSLNVFDAVIVIISLVE